MTKADAAHQLIDHLSISLADGSFVRLNISQPRQAANNPEKILARRVELKQGPHLSFTFRYATKDITKNMALPAGIEWLKGQVGCAFQSALLSTIRRDWQLSVSKSGECRLVAHKPSVTQAPSRKHDLAGQEILDGSARDWLHGLGVTDAGGKVRERMADKYRQINHYLEIFSHLAEECGWRPRGSLEREGVATSGCEQNENAPTLLTIADMGSGKGYLTFGVWHLLRRAWRIPVRVIGVEALGDLARKTTDVAQEIKAEGLEFISGTIDTAALPRVDALIALHACNTATDHAILRGIQLGARLILTAPCCHKELRPQMNHPLPLALVLRHGVMKERMSEWVTDGLRALFLEWAGYRTKIFEFVSTEHTAKNLMISAVLDGQPFGSATARGRITELKAFFGIKQHALDSLLER